MLGQRGKTWRLVGFAIICALLALAPGGAAHAFCPPLVSLTALNFPLVPIESATPLEAQLLGEKHSLAPTSETLPLHGTQRPESETALKLPGNLELRISFLYDGKRSTLFPERPIQSHLLFRSSVEYRLLPNLQVGLSGFLYQTPSDNHLFQRRYGSMVMGWGPGIKYDLGRWSFTLRSQLETGSRERGENLQNWFRVWYAF